MWHKDQCVFEILNWLLSIPFFAAVESQAVRRYQQHLERGVLVRLLHRIAEDDMIACFLKAEITSERFGHKLLMQLKHDNKDLSIVNAPDLSREKDNEYRRHLLASYRAYVFEALPRHTAGHSAYSAATKSPRSDTSTIPIGMKSPTTPDCRALS